ncbi:MAG: helix-turn-helix domain-containing protein [Spirochaetes bacterium]|nr:helix-turn-helix domain-containing protein [Spirochaetota bacterium]
MSPLCESQLIANPRTTAQEVLGAPAQKWRQNTRRVLAFGVTQDIVWLRCRLRNATPETRWSIVSQYNFERSISVIPVRDGKVQEPLTIHAKSFWRRNSAFTIILPQNQRTEFLVCYESDLAKAIFMQIMPERELDTQEKEEGVFFLVFSAIMALFVLLNLLLVFSLKSIIPLLYGLTTFGYYFYQIIQFGFGTVLIYPATPEFNGNMVSISAGVAIVFYQSFFQRLLAFRQIVPRLNLAMNILSVISLTYVFVTIFNFLPIGFLQKLGRLLFFTATILVFSGGWTVYRLNFRPALYSIYGFVIMVICQSFYFAVMSGLIDFGAYFVKMVLSLGQLVEYLFFFYTLSLRLRNKDQRLLLRQIAETEEIRRDLDRNDKLRLPPEKAERIKKELETVLREDRVYCDEDLSLERLAAMLNVTRHELSDLLNKSFRTSFYDFINRYRIEAAEKMLMDDPKLKILDAAMAVGFNSKSTFNKEFKRIKGTTPTQIRKK